jgi:uncharacterized protein (TIGR02001 family)
MIYLQYQNKEIKMKKINLLTILIVSIISSVTLQAKIGLSANIGVQSNYIWRGMTQSDNKPSLQAGVDVDSHGAYVGSWIATIDFNDDNNYELDLYGGYSNSFKMLNYDVGYIYYKYDGTDNIDFSEIYINLTHQIMFVDGLEASITYTKGLNNSPDNKNVALTYDAKVLTISGSFNDYDTYVKTYTLGISKSFKVFNQDIDTAVDYAISDINSLYTTVGISF